MQILHTDDHTTVYQLDVEIVPFPSQTQRDRFITRPETARFRTCKDCIWYEWRATKREFPAVGAHVIFCIPVPRSYSNRREAELVGCYHNGRRDGAKERDVDNCQKTFSDALFPESRGGDSHIADIRLTKIWAPKGKGSIIVALPHTHSEYSLPDYILNAI